MVWTACMAFGPKNSRCESRCLRLLGDFGGGRPRELNFRRKLSSARELGRRMQFSGICENDLIDRNNRRHMTESA
jgi:hypothetical protein